MTTTAHLSYELLCEIFQILCDEPISLHISEDTSLFDKFPWAVGLVCQRWRLSNPRLWTFFILDHLEDGTFSDRYIVEMNRRTVMHVERSSQLVPLTIMIEACQPRRQSTWRILLSLMHRWKAAVLKLHAPSTVDGLRKCRGKMPILESLEVWDRLPSDLCIDAFESTPRLVQANLLRWDSGFGLLPLSQLKKILDGVT